MVSAASKKLLKELPDEAEMHSRFIGLLNSTDHALALTGASYLDKALETLLVARFISLSSDDHTRMFDGSAGGILGTSAAKIRIAYALELIDASQYDDFKLINDIRNVFAHTLHNVDFNHALVRQDCAKFTGSGLYRFVESNAKNNYLGAVSYLYGYLRGKLKTMALASALKKYQPPAKPKPLRDKQSGPSRKIRRHTAASKKPQRPPGSSQGK